MHFFADLATHVMSKWRLQNYNEWSFPDIAAAALLETQPNLHVSLDDVFQWLPVQTGLPLQNQNSTFSDFQLQVFANERFVIEILFWTDGTTFIHQHGFAGAFCVMSGSSLHTEFKFNLSKHINGGLILGEMTSCPPELFQTGSVQRISAGNRYIHRLFHLEKPSITVVIRTHPIPEALPQYEYFYDPKSSKGIGMDAVSVSASQLFKRQYQGAQLLAGLRHPSLTRFLSQVAASQDVHAWFRIARPVLDILDSDQRARLFLEARKQLGPTLDSFITMLPELNRINPLIKARSQIIDPELRYFLGVLINSRTSRDIERLLESRFPGDKNGAELYLILNERLNDLKLTPPMPTG